MPYTLCALVVAVAALAGSLALATRFARPELGESITFFKEKAIDKEKKKKKGHGKTEDLRTEPDLKARLGSQAGANTKHQAPSRRPMGIH